MSEEKVETEKVLLCYIGSRLNAQDKESFWFFPVNREEWENGTAKAPDPKMGDNWYSYKSKNVKKYMARRAGQVVEVEQKKESNGSSIFPKTASYVGIWPNQDERTAWQTEDRTVQNLLAMYKRAKKEGSEDEFAALKPIRNLYAKLVSREQKAALLASIIAYITAGRIRETETIGMWDDDD